MMARCETVATWRLALAEKLDAEVDTCGVLQWERRKSMKQL